MTRNNGETSSALPCKVKNYLSNRKGESATDRAKDHGRSSWLTAGPSARDPRFPTEFSGDTGERLYLVLSISRSGSHLVTQHAIALARNEQFHARTKHIDIRFHFIRYVIEAGKIVIDYCPTEDMVANTLTKALPSAKAKHFASALGLRKV